MPGFNEVQWTIVTCVLALLTGVLALNGPNVCMVKQKYNITKLVKYRAPMSIRTYEWCFSMPPRCSKWNTEMRDLTKLETEERTAEVAVCCPGYKMRDVSCVPICPNGKTGAGCTQDCPKNKWGPNCVNDCKPCDHGSCSSVSGECRCEDGWQGESCESSMSTTTEDILTTTKTTRMTVIPSTKPTTTSIATSTTTQATTSTSTTLPSTSTLKSTIKLSTTQNTVTEELLTPVTMNSDEKAIIIPKEDIKTQTKESYSTTNATPTTITNTIVEQIKLNNKDTFISKQDVIKETPTVNEITQSLDLNQGITTTDTYNVFFRDLVDTVRPIIFEQDIATKWPIIDRNLVKEGNVEDNIIIESTTILPNTSISVTEPTTNIVNITTTTPIPREALGIAISENIVNSTEEPKLTTSSVKTTEMFTTPELPILFTTEPPTIQTTQKIESTSHTEASTRGTLTTAKFKPKEIWIKPAQKFDSTDLKSKNNYELQKHKPTNKELSINTTPKTIIVSIIPTSVSYATFKKIALTTIAYIPVKFNTPTKNSNNIEQGITKAMPAYFNTTSSTTEISTVPSIITTLLSSRKPTSITLNNDNTTSSIPITTKAIITYSTTTNAATSNNLNISTNNSIKILTTTAKTVETTKVIKNYHWITTKESFKTNKSFTPKMDVKNKNTETKVVTNNKTLPTTKAILNDNESLTNDKITTETPADEETFHILTEPEHITAVMSDKESDRTSMDLKSVISIAGGVMMAVITVAVIIVMIERCKRPRYENVRKINDIRMQVMIDGNDAPPPYVRSIFHTPLPEPPMTDKCHYQPISTLDRNLKQFMRPVVVKTISPIMLENFRGILECHYDHLPRRSHDFQPIPVRCSAAPSLDCCELTPLRSVAERDIDSMKREAKLDEIDNTTAEPLYAEIPCWRPPSEHAIEILNINGEAVTEL